MESRQSKYSTDNTSMSRVSRNEDLYKQINTQELDNFSVRSNATVIGTQEQEIDIEKIKKILDTKYNDHTVRKSIRVEEPVRESRVIVDDTKEYDLNAVLEKARDEKQDSETYEDVRNKKLRDTQFDILNKLNIENEEEKDEVKTAQEEDLMELINTITINEAKKKETEEEKDDEDLDLLDDLVGSDNTQVYESMADNVKALETVKKEYNGEVKEDAKTIDNSFYTTGLFKQKDFANDEEDFVEDDKLNVGIKILIVLVVISFLVGLFLFLKSFIGF